MKKCKQIDQNYRQNSKKIATAMDINNNGQKKMLL